jgi:hypothetical protein
MGLPQESKLLNKCNMIIKKKKYSLYIMLGFRFSEEASSLGSISFPYLPALVKM